MTLPREATVELRHSFDAAHRLPQLSGGNSKCFNLHGHTWRTVLGITGPVQQDMTVVEFGSVKSGWRIGIDTLFDHGALLGAADPLVPALQNEGCKVHVFGRDAYAEDLPWPSVEAVVTTLGRLAQTLPLPDGCRVSSVYVAETPTNAVTWNLP